jgi:GNAT superfamily N-acetyltransferase
MTAPTFQFGLVDPLGRHARQYRQLHNLLFANTAMSSEWVDWYHGRIGALAGGPARTRTYGVFDGDLLVGIWSVEPKAFVAASGEETSVGRCFSVGIHPEYRRHGLFVRLSSFAIAQEREKADYDHILGFPQIGRPVIGGHLKAGWEIVQDVPVRRFDTERLEGFTPRSRARWIPSFEDLRPSADPRGAFRESPAYRNLRWLEHPDNQYVCLAHEQAHVVMKPYRDLCHVLDLRGDRTSVRLLLEVAKSLARRHRWKELNLWCAGNEVHRPEILDAGFVEGSEFAPAVVLIAVRIRSSQPFTLGNECHLQMGSEEIY